jgi:hypothetical protein
MRTLLFLIAGCSLCVAATTWAQQPKLLREPLAVPADQAQLQQSWFLLKSGSVFVADIVDVGAKIRVKVGGIISEIDSRDVLLTGNSLAEIAQQRYELARRESIENQWPILTWLVSQQQYQYAEQLLIEMSQNTNADPLRIAGWKQHLKRLQQVSSQPHTPSIQTVSHQTPVPSESTVPKTTTATTTSVTHQQLAVTTAATSNSLAPELTAPASLQLFTGRVQPLLSQRCANAGCHTPNSDREFVFEKVRADQLVNRDLTLRNLTQVSRWVNRQRPDESDLLTQALKAHGNLTKSPVGREEQTTINTLRQWLWIASGQINTTPATLNVANTEPVPDPTIAHIEPLRATFPGSMVSNEPAPTTASTMPDDAPGWKAALQREKKLRDDEARAAELFRQSDERKQREATEQARLLKLTESSTPSPAQPQPPVPTPQSTASTLSAALPQPATSTPVAEPAILVNGAVKSLDLPPISELKAAPAVAPVTQPEQPALPKDYSNIQMNSNPQLGPVPPDPNRSNSAIKKPTANSLPKHTGKATPTPPKTLNPASSTPGTKSGQTPGVVGRSDGKNPYEVDIFSPPMRR